MSLATAVAEAFELQVQGLRALDVLAHNQHFVASTDEGLLHITLHDLVDGSAEVDELEEVHAFTAALEGPTARLAASVRRGVNGRYLERTVFGHVTVRGHDGVVAPSDVDAGSLVAVAREHALALRAAVRPGARLRSGLLRFMTPGAALDAAGSAITSRLARWMSAEQRDAFRRVLDDVRRAPAIAAAALVPVHGDLETSNLVIVDGAINVIDHGCVHWDHSLYDLAHLMLSSVCGGYFCGPVDRERATEFLTAIEVAEPGVGLELVDACRYVMLEKLAGVERERDLFAARRLAALEDLEYARHSMS